MAKRKNRYQKKAQQQDFLGSLGIKHEEGDFEKAALAFGKDVLFGAVGGTVAGAVIGRPALLVGLAVSLTGHYMKSNATAALGIGMMAAGGYKTASSINGPEHDGIDGIKDRLLALREDFKHKLFLDKILKPKASADTTDDNNNGVGEVQYFNYPNAELQGGGDLDMGALDRIERQIADSNREFQNRAEADFSGADISEQNF
jgi:hypothetical protein